MKKEKIILIGGGGHCSSCIDVIEQEGKYSIAGIVDTPDKLGKSVSGYKITATDNDFSELIKEYSFFFITVGQVGPPESRVKIFNKLKKFNVHFPVIVSPLAYVSGHARISAGTIIMHQAMINANAKVGEQCIINSKALVEHDALIGNFCHVSTGAIINGGVRVGSNSFIGSGAVSKEYISIPENSFIKANSIIK